MPADGPDWQSATDVAPIPLGVVSIPAGQTTATVTFTIPGTAAGVKIAPTSLGALNSALTTVVKGVTTGQQYLNDIQPANNFAQYLIPSDGATEAQITVKMTSAIAAPGPGPMIVGYVSALNAGALSGIYSGTREPLSVAYVTPPTVYVGVPGNNSLQSALVALAPAAGATNVVIPAIAGKTVTVVGWELWFNALTSATLGRYRAQMQSTLGDSWLCSIAFYNATAAGQQGVCSSAWPTFPPTVTASYGVEIVTNGANPGGLDIEGVIWYTQQ